MENIISLSWNLRETLKGYDIPGDNIIQKFIKK